MWITGETAIDCGGKGECVASVLKWHKVWDACAVQEMSE